MVANRIYSLVPEKPHCRIVGLTATPGRSNEKIQEVIGSLRITHLDWFDEGDPEIKKYIHEKILDVCSFFDFSFRLQLIFNNLSF